MKAAVVTTPGNISIESIPDPTPGSGEVVVEVAACGVCGTDLHIFDGEFAPRFPIVPGHEFAGVVVALGADVSFITEGDRVAVDPSLPCHACRYCRQGRSNLCDNWAAIGVTADGGAAQYAVAPQGNCVRIPEAARLEDFALVEPLACAISGMDALPRRPSEHYLIYGAGTMGVLIAGMARTSGAASVTVVEPRAERRLGVESLTGADLAVASSDEADRRDWDTVIDCTGVAAAIEDGLSRVAKGGTYLQFGVPHTGTRVEIDPHRVYQHEITIAGSMSVRNSFERAVDLLSHGALDPRRIITAEFALEEYRSALEAVRSGQGLKTQVIATGTPPRSID
ncbi:zinc-dependent alcohol dehydrogenase family protein [Demetria terragena]|uniref:zinc-dependent alcohol dehydrogenase family protein n=1 Tax=Demetria terragena TaxID=63959 RepID=UPI000361DB6B|nr:zinc-dependent alcohol dehydrogenase family protein [Demetria terragena]